MKYILINDCLSFMKKFCKYLLLFFTILICTVFIQNLVGIKLNEDVFADMVGLKLDANGSFYSIIMFLLNFAINLLVAFQIFDNDIKNGMANVFLRISKKKWVIYKFISIFSISLILRIVVYILLFLLFKILNGDLSLIIIRYFIINILFIMLINYLFLNIF